MSRKTRAKKLRHKLKKLSANLAAVKDPIGDTPARSGMDVARQYFEDSPDAMDDVAKAHYAYHSNITIAAHVFPSRKTWAEAAEVVARARWGEAYVAGDRRNLAEDMPDWFRQEACECCGRSRSEIRWGEADPRCQPHISRGSIEEAILREETQYYALLNSTTSDRLETLLAQKGYEEITPSALFYLQSEKGIPPDVVSAVLNIDIERLMPEYEELRRLEAEKSRAKSKHKG